MDYACLKQQIFAHPPYQLVPLRQQDLLDIKNWRNAQMNILRQHTLLTDTAQEQYYQTAILPLFTQTHPNQVLFSFLLNDSCIGYGGLVHLDWHCRRGEVSFLLDPQRTIDPHQYQQDFTIFLTLLKQIAFIHLKLHRLYTETFDIRPHHIAVLEAQGFIPEGRLKEHVIVEGKFIDSLMHGCINHG